ncbi:hypothetical protein ACO0LH_03155 [Undibacterium sp. TJN19]
MTSFHAWHALAAFVTIRHHSSLSSLFQGDGMDALCLIWRKLALAEFFYNTRTYFQVMAYRGGLGN